MAGDQHDRNLGVDRVNRRAQFEPVHSGHTDVGDDDPRKIGGDPRQHAVGVGKRCRRQPGEVERLDIGLAQRRIVVDEKDRLLGGKETHAGLSVRRKPAPPSGEGTSVSVPPKPRMMSLAIASPSPSPSGRPVTKGVNSRSEEHTSELQSLMRISYAVFCLKKKTKQYTI